MPNTDQAQADSAPEQPTVMDPLDAVNTPNNGTSAFDAYEAEVAALLASSQNVQGDEPAVVEPEVVEPAVEAVEPAHEEEEVPAVEDEEPEVPELKDQMRPRLKDPMDIAVATLAKAKGISLIEAARIVAGEPTRATEPVVNTTPKETVADIDAQIKDMRAKWLETSNALEFDDANKLMVQLEELRDKREELRVVEAQERTRSEQEAARKFNDEYDASEAKVVTFYPETTIADSPMVKKMIELDAQMRELGDPLYHSPDKPWTLAKAAALALGRPMTKPGTVNPKQSPSRVPVHQPASGNARTTAAAPAQTLEDAIAKADTLEEYEKLVGRG